MLLRRRIIVTDLTSYLQGLLPKASPAGTAPYAHGNGVDCVLVDGPYGSASQEVFEAFMESDHLDTLRGEYNKNFGDASERVGFGYVQVWP